MVSLTAANNTPGGKYSKLIFSRIQVSFTFHVPVGHLALGIVATTNRVLTILPWYQSPERNNGVLPGTSWGFQYQTLAPQK